MSDRPFGVHGSGLLCPPKADVARRNHQVRFVQISLQKSATADGRSAISLGAAGVDPPAPDALYATPTLRNTQRMAGWRSSNQRCQPPQILGDGGQNKLVLGTSRST
jgi:hypothetical protein